MRDLRRFALGPALAVLVAGCAAPPVPPADAVNDPFEVQNRQVHAFNRAADTAVVRPAAQVWGAVLPPPVRRSAANVVANLDTPGDVVNDLLQGRMEDAAHNFFRFAVNSTLGLAGLFDPARSMGLAARETDFGQTLHVWGAAEGAYVELPLFGPRTERHAYGTVVDLALNPSRLLLPADAPALGPTAVRLLETRYSFGPTIDATLYDSADSYALSRSLYLQNRRFFLADEGTAAYIDPYDDLFGE